MSTSQQLPNPDEVARWYDARYSSKQEGAFGRPPQESLKRLDKLRLTDKDLDILDIGAGQGFFIRAVEDAGHHGTGIDISFEGINIARRISPQAHFTVANGQQLPFADSKFDVVTFWGTLEHHPDMRQALAECKRVIRPGGTILLRVPNLRFWPYIILSKFGLQVGTDQSDLIEHLLTLDEWCTLVKQFGLEVVHIEPDNWFLEQPLTTVSGFAAKVKMGLRKFTLLVAPLRLTYVFDILCTVPIEAS